MHDFEQTPLLIPIGRKHRDGTCEGACKALGGLSHTTVYGLVNRGELTKVNIGTRSFITAESIKAYYERLTAAAGRQPADVTQDGAA